MPTRPTRATLIDNSTHTVIANNVAQPYTWWFESTDAYTVPATSISTTTELFLNDGIAVSGTPRLFDLLSCDIVNNTGVERFGLAQLAIGLTTDTLIAGGLNIRLPKATPVGLLGGRFGGRVTHYTLSPLPLAVDTRISIGLFSCTAALDPQTDSNRDTRLYVGFDILASSLTPIVNGVAQSPVTITASAPIDFIIERPANQEATDKYRLVIYVSDVLVYDSGVVSNPITSGNTTFQIRVHKGTVRTNNRTLFMIDYLYAYTYKQYPRKLKDIPS